MRTRFGFVGLSLVFSSVAFGATIHVPADAPTIQIAISNAQPADTIIVDPGTYFEAINFGGKIIVVQSTNPFDPAVVASTIIDAGGLGSVVTFSGGEDQSNTILDGFTITGGTIGIDGNGSHAIIQRCVIRDNSSSGISDADGRIEDCQIIDNESTGLTRCDGDVRRCLIRNNRFAGVSDCNGIVIDSVIEDTRDGAGVQVGLASFVRCTIRGNSTSGLFLNNGSISQSLIAGNGTHGIDGPSNNFSSIENCVIAGNGLSGVRNSSQSVLSCTITGNRRFGIEGHTGVISHTILWDNQLGALTSSTTPLFSGTFNPFFVQPGFFNNLNNQWIDGDYHVSPKSPFIDAGDPQYLDDPTAPTLDIDGNPRVVGARIDIGAFEFQAECVGDDFDGDGTADICDRDIDNDGITNVADRCDFTPPGTPVNPDGRPLSDLNLDCDVNLADFRVFQNDIR